MTSNISKFYQKTRNERLELLVESGFLSEESQKLMTDTPLLDEQVANHLIENQLTQFPLPMGVGLNFIVDDKDVIVPMVVEEPSVIAACSNAAKFMRKTGGFKTSSSERRMIGQIIIQDLDDYVEAEKLILKSKLVLIEQSKLIHPSIVKRGGGVTDIETRIILNETSKAEFLTLHILVDVKDAMGANIVNTILEGLRPLVEEITKGQCLMSILSNYSDHSLITASCSVDVKDLNTPTVDGLTLAQKIVDATRYAHLDPYRAATHNKGIMNGIDSVVIATGNDPRAVSAGAHTYAARDGQYRSLSSWKLTEDNLLVGELTLPMAIGSVGGAASVLPLVKISHELMRSDSAVELGRIIVSAGLAQNFAALKALVSEGIQRGHMNLHLQSLAIHAGAQGEEISQLTEILRKEKASSLDKAKEFLFKLRQ